MLLNYNIITALPFRPPKIVVVSRHPSPVDGCGTIAILGCTADQVKHLFSPPNIVWIGPNDTEISTEVDSDPRMDPATKQLIFFSNITSVNRGTYSCRAVVNIPKAQIVNHIDESLATVGTEGIVTSILKCNELIRGTVSLYVACV